MILKLVCDDPEALDLLDRATVAKQGGDRKSEAMQINRDNRTVDIEPNRGTSRQYALRRLRKAAPELHARVLAGELSAHAAMVEAGFRRAPAPLAQLERAWRKASESERAEFARRNREQLVAALVDAVDPEAQS